MVKHDVAIAFPGQGIQKPGMASPIIDSAAWRLFDEASELVNYDLGKLVLNGPAEALNNTAYAQVAIFVTCFATPYATIQPTSPPVPGSNPMSVPSGPPHSMVEDTFLSK